MWLLIILLILLLIITGLLLMPLELEINTPQQVYELRAGKIFRAGVKADENSAGIYIKVIWWRKYFPFIPPEPAKSSKKRTEPKKVTTSRKKRIKNLPQRILAVLKAFRIKEFELKMDTGDYITNAYLYPVFYMVKLKTGKNMEINFNGQTSLVLHVQNNLWRIGRAFVRKV